MKSFLKFLALLTVSLIVFMLILFVLDPKDALTGIPLMSVILIGGFFAIASFSYCYIFEWLQARDHSLMKSMFYGAFACFAGTFIFSYGSTFSGYNNDYSGPLIPFLQALFFITVFLFYVGVMRIYNALRQNIQLDFPDKWQFYLKMNLSIVTFVFLLLILVNLDWDERQMNSPDIFERLFDCFWLAFQTTFVAFVSLWLLSKIAFFKKNQIAAIVLVIVIGTLTDALGSTLGQLFLETIVAYAFVVSFVTVSIVAIINYRNTLAVKDLKISKLTASFSKKEAEYLELKNQINPHFLFNNLNTLIAFIEINPQKAIAFGHHLSNVYRHYLKNQSEDFVSLAEELVFVQEYLEIYKAKFESGFTFEITGNIAENQFILSAALQELTDNVFKHNNLEEDNPLSIIISVNDNALVFTNSMHKKMNAASHNSGLENIGKRYKILTGSGITIELTAAFFSVAMPVLTVENK